MQYFPRQEEYDKNPVRIVGLSFERDDISYDILIPWDQVTDVAVVTPSVLAITARVGRYCGTNRPVGSSAYQNAEVEIFVTNCLASELYYLVKERSDMYLTRENVKLLIAQGVTTAVGGDSEVEPAVGEDGTMETVNPNLS